MTPKFAEQQQASVPIGTEACLCGKTQIAWTWSACGPFGP